MGHLFIFEKSRWLTRMVRYIYGFLGIMNLLFLFGQVFFVMSINTTTDEFGKLFLLGLFVIACAQNNCKHFEALTYPATMQLL